MVDSTILPPELWVEIFSWIRSLAHLSTLALVCHNWRIEAERFLYRSTDIYRRTSVSSLLHRMKSPTRPIASHIHKFVAFTNSANLDLVYNVLSIVHNLKYLTLLKRGAMNFYPPLPTNLPFALEIFKTDYNVDQGLHGFLKSQHTIRFFSWTPIGPSSPLHALSPSDLPNVRAIHVRKDAMFAHQQLVIPSIRNVDIRIPHFEADYNYPQVHITAIRVAYVLDNTVRALASIFPNITYLSTRTDITRFGGDLYVSLVFPPLVHFLRLRKVQFVVSGASNIPVTLPIDGPASLRTVEVMNEPNHYSLDRGGGEIGVDRFQKDDTGQFLKTSYHRWYHDTYRLEWATWDG